MIAGICILDSGAPSKDSFSTGCVVDLDIHWSIEFENGDFRESGRALFWWEYFLWCLSATKQVANQLRHEWAPLLEDSSPKIITEMTYKYIGEMFYKYFPLQRVDKNMAMCNGTRNVLTTSLYMILISHQDWLLLQFRIKKSPRAHDTMEVWLRWWHEKFYTLFQGSPVALTRHRQNRKPQTISSFHVARVLWESNPFKADLHSWIWHVLRDF